MASPAHVTGPEELRALLRQARSRSKHLRRSDRPPLTTVGRAAGSEAKHSARMSEGALAKALRLLSRLGRVNPRECSGRDVLNPLMSKVLQSKRVLKMFGHRQAGREQGSQQRCCPWPPRQ